MPRWVTQRGILATDELPVQFIVALHNESNDPGTLPPPSRGVEYPEYAALVDFDRKAGYSSHAETTY
jgi:hypothetical protein